MIWHAPESIALKKLVVVVSVDGCVPAWSGPYDPYDVPDSLLFTITPVDRPRSVNVNYLFGKNVRFGLAILDANNSSFAQGSVPEDVFRSTQVFALLDPNPFEMLESPAQMGFVLEPERGFPWQLRIEDATGGVRTSTTLHQLFVRVSLAYTGPEERPEPMWAHLLKGLLTEPRNREQA